VQRVAGCRRVFFWRSKCKKTAQAEEAKSQRTVEHNG